MVWPSEFVRRSYGNGLELKLEIGKGVGKFLTLKFPASLFYLRCCLILRIGNPGGVDACSRWLGLSDARTDGLDFAADIQRGWNITEILFYRCRSSGYRCSGLPTLKGRLAGLRESCLCVCAVSFDGKCCFHLFVSDRCNTALPRLYWCD